MVEICALGYACVSAGALAEPLESAGWGAVSEGEDGKLTIDVAGAVLIFPTSGHGSLLLKFIRGEFGDLGNEAEEEFVDAEPTPSHEFLHLGVFGVVEMGENRGLVGRFAQVVHEFGVGFGTGDGSAEGGVFAQRDSPG